MMRLALLLGGAAHVATADESDPGAWEHVGPHNIFDAYNENGTGPLPMGEAGTLASAASPKANPLLIYAGGQNNGVSSGVLKTVDGGRHWTRNSKGLWDTRILGVWIHPDDPQGSHVLAGTHSGIYESTDAAESWTFRNDTEGWGSVMSFRQGVIAGKPYIFANVNGAIGTLPLGGGKWEKITAPGGIAPNAYLSVVTDKAEQKTELLTCIGGWGGGKLYYGAIDSPTEITWEGPLNVSDSSLESWQFFPGKSAIWGKCKTPTSCDAGIHVLGKMPTLEACQTAINASHPFKVASWTYQHPQVSGGYGGMCYAMEGSIEWSPQPQANVDSGRAPGTVAGGPIDCANAAVDPNDRNHFVYSKGGQYRAWESTDGGKTVKEFTNHNTGCYFVMIDKQGWLYTATQAGAFVSEDKGETWNPYHVIMHRRSGGIMDRVPHDYQNIVPDFRDDGIAFPSDQGLHIVNRSSYDLISAVGDLHNAMSLSALISPSKTTPGSRNIVSNIWDWDVVATWDDGKTWAGWATGEKAPASCGEGGGGQAMGTSGHLIMFHHQHWWSSSDGGHNFERGNLPGGGGAFDYVRQAGSRVEPAGKCFALMSAPSPLPPSPPPASLGQDDDDDDEHEYRPDMADPDEDEDEDEDVEELEAEAEAKEMKSPLYNASLLQQQGSTAGTKVYLMTSTDYGGNWSYKTPMPDTLQASDIVVDPMKDKSLYALTDNCLAHSTDDGVTWSPCSTAAGLKGGRFAQLIIKDSSTMFLLRKGLVPLRTTAGPAGPWTPLSSPTLTELYAHGATFSGSLSWTGKTLVLHGADLSAIGRGERATKVYKSTNDGEAWTDEGGDIVTISPGSGVWYEKDFYFVTAGEGVTVKRNFEQ